ncbi:DUF3954 domain-containing protein [Bacillus toyonensis]|nr:MULTISPECIES: DUF3954 domain-containing protein [Bacillus]HEQ3529420.1 DUF3954 domain-containing protein [Bacillus cereus]MBW3490811.1 DUF3954 domain-containing protein [Bacillus sp. FDAARGOS_1420]PEZ39703.1 DUF3954 domain-containing protein [Bacillus thuringiensis]PGC57933.1 DUF3954 domain-containing protein [Bacillus toyonensis]PGC79578.1 DUF3954 domain-containing protein [Bacillus toyonensis]
MKSEIDMKTNGIYIVEDGKIIFLKPPESRYGQQVVHWVDGKVSHTQTTSTVKFKR